jgi:hypothetical protein
MITFSMTVDSKIYVGKPIFKQTRAEDILSINDHPRIQGIFKGFRISREKTVYTAGHGHTPHKTVTELLISNY